MVDYIVNILDDTPEDIKGQSATPASYHLFDIVGDATKLSQTDADLFNNFVTQILYLSNQALPDINFAV